MRIYICYFGRSLNVFVCLLSSLLGQCLNGTEKWNPKALNSLFFLYQNFVPAVTNKNISPKKLVHSICKISKIPQNQTKKTEIYKQKSVPKRLKKKKAFCAFGIANSIKAHLRLFGVSGGCRDTLVSEHHVSHG